MVRCIRCGTENADNAVSCVKCNATLKRVCPRCRAMNAPKQVFCGNCGVKLVNICPRCKTQNSPVQKYCGNCGLKIINICPKCNMHNPIGQKYCGNCATRLIAPKPQKPPQPGQKQSPQQRQPTIQKMRHPAAGTVSKKQAQPPLRPKQSLPPRPQSKGVPVSSAQKPQVNQQLIPPEQQKSQEARPVQQPSQPKISDPKLEQQVQEPKAMQQTTQPAQQEAPKPKVVQQELPPQQALAQPSQPPQEQVQELDTLPLPQTLSETSSYEPIKPTDPSLDDPQKNEIEEIAIQENFQEIELKEKPSVSERATKEETVIQEDPEFSSSEKQKPKELPRFAVLTIEIVNFASLSEKIEANVLKNIKNKLWEVCSNVAGLNKESLSEISLNTALISFAHAENKLESSLTAIQVAGEIFELTKTLNQQFENALNINLKIKIGISFNDTEGMSQLERSIASVGSIVVSEEIKKDTETLCSYDPIGPLPIGNQMVSFYKYKIPDTPIKIPSDASSATSAHDAQGASMADSAALGDDYIGDFSEGPEPEAKIDSKTLDKDGIVSSLMNICSLTDSTGHGNLVNVNGEDGSGKSTVVRTLKTSLSPQSFIWMIARCNYIEKMFPLSTVKDLLLNFFGLPYLVYDISEAKKLIKSGIEALVGPNDQICSVINSVLLNEELTGLNKGHIINALYTVIKAITQKATVILCIEDLEAIDDASMEVFEALIDARLADQKVVILTTTHTNFNIAREKPNFVYNSKFTQYNIRPVVPQELDQRINEMIKADLRLPANLKEQIINATNCIPMGAESALFLMYELGVIANTEQGPVFNEEAHQWELPPNIQEILRHRLHRLSQVNPNAFMLLQLASVIGPKFDPEMLRDLSLLGKEFEENMQWLTSYGYLVFESQHSMVFKHNMFWEVMYYAGIPNENRAQSHLQILSFVEKVVHSGGTVDRAFVAYHAENAGKRRKALNIWNAVANKILALGAPKAYTELMKRYINLIEQTDLPDKQQLQVQALETLGKICFIIEPGLAIQAITSILPVIEQQNQPARLIELRGILGLAYEQQGRWEEAIEQFNRTLELVPTDVPSVERALLLMSVIPSYEKMGKIAWIINTCQKEIFPALEKAIQSASTPENMNLDQLYRAYCNAKLSYASALIISGHHEAFNVFNEIMPEIEKRGYQDLGLKAYILQAKWRAVRGELELSEKILTQTREYLNKIPGLNNFTVLWGEAACFLNLEVANWEVLSTISEGLKQQAKKLNNYSVVALCMLVKAMQEQVTGDASVAIKLLNDTLNYSTKYKLATYALMTWYFMAATEVQNKNLDKAYNIASKALEVAKVPDTFNLNAIVTLNRLMGEITIRKGDLESAGAHLEEAWKLATELQNPSQIAKVAITIGQMYQELVSSLDENKQENAEKSMEFLGNAHNIFQQLGHQLHVRRAEQAIENLKVVCRVNSVKI